MPNIRPDTGGRRWSLFQVASSVALWGGTGAVFPSKLLRLPAALYGACPVLPAVPALGCSAKARNKKLRLRFVPSPSEWLRQPGLDGCTLPGCGAPFPLCSPSLSFCPPRSGVCAWLTIQNLRRSLIRNWRPFCSAVGAAVLGVEPAPFPSPLPPASSGAGLVRSLRALLWTCSDPLFCQRPAVCSGRLIFSLSLAISQFKLVTHKSSF